MRPSQQPTIELIRTGVPGLDQYGGIPRSGVTQLCAPAGISCGRTTVLLSLMAKLTQESHFCALVDAGDCFDPESAQAAGVDLSHALWVRCSSKRGSMKSMEQAIKAADILLQSGGFFLLTVDLRDIEERAVRRVPLSTWFRFKTVAEKTGIMTLFFMSCPAAQSFAALTLTFQSQRPVWIETASVPHSALISHWGCDIDVQARRWRKPVRSAPPERPLKFQSTSIRG